MTRKITLMSVVGRFMLSNKREEWKGEQSEHLVGPSVNVEFGRQSWSDQRSQVRIFILRIYVNLQYIVFQLRFVFVSVSVLRL